MHVIVIFETYIINPSLDVLMTVEQFRNRTMMTPSLIIVPGIYHFGIMNKKVIMGYYGKSKI